MHREEGVHGRVVILLDVAADEAIALAEAHTCGTRTVHGARVCMIRMRVRVRAQIGSANGGPKPDGGAWRVRAYS